MFRYRVWGNNARACVLDHLTLPWSTRSTDHAHTRIRLVFHNDTSCLANLANELLAHRSTDRQIIMSVSPVRRSRRAAQKAVAKKRWIVSSSESEQEKQDFQDNDSDAEVVTTTRKGGRTSTRATANGMKKETNGKVIIIDSSDGEVEDYDTRMDDGEVDIDASSERLGGLESEPEITGPIGSRPYILSEVF